MCRGRCNEGETDDRRKLCISLNQLFRPINNDECWQCKTTDFRVTHFNESNNYDDANDSDDYDKDDKVNDNHLNKQTYFRGY